MGQHTRVEAKQLRQSAFEIRNRTKDKNEKRFPAFFGG
jgi:hypothetical protein